ncbi:hypothetical protein KAI87_08875, partial [Myxococcota bacterium]|nr:hypothetical protein [Myxococcota bacterium]
DVSTRHYDGMLGVSIKNNILTSAGSIAVNQLLVGQASADLQVEENVIKGTRKTLYLSANSGKGGPGDASAWNAVVKNNILASSTAGLSVNTYSLSSSEISIISNEIIGIESGAFKSNSFSEDSIAVDAFYVYDSQMEVVGNRITNAGGISISNDTMDAVTVVSNNIMVAPADSGSIALEVSSLSETHDIEISHNTQDGFANGLKLRAYYLDEFGGEPMGSFDIHNNMITGTGSGVDDHAITVDGYESFEYNISFNMVDKADEAVGSNFLGAPTYTSVPDTFVFADYYNPDTNTFYFAPDFDPGFVVGDKVLLELDTAPRTVTDVVYNEDTEITVGGDPLPYYTYALSVYYWAQTSAYAPVDFALSAGSDGVDAADPDSPLDVDGSRADVGALGGPGAILLP